MLRYAVVGTSEITNYYVNGAGNTGVWELTAIYSRTYEKGLAFGEAYGVDTVYTDFEAFAKSTLFDAVYVASPNRLHYEQCKILLNHNKHVICEKPFTSYLWQAKELFDIAEKNQKVLMEAIMFMHQPNRVVLDQAVESLGNITMASFDNAKRSSKYDAYLAGELPNIFNPDLHAGALMDMGVYSLYPALYFFGRPDTFVAKASMMERGADGLGSVMLQYADKVVNVRYSKIGSGLTGSDIQGAKGSVSIQSILHLGDISYVNNTGEHTLLANETPKPEIMANEAIDFYKFICEPEEQMEFYEKCKEMSLLVCEYLELIRKEVGLDF